jgi:hypothetical protein
LFACFVAVLVTWMSFASDARELRVGTLSMLETHIMMSSLIFLSHSNSHASFRTSSHALPHVSHGPNHRSYGLDSRENRLVPKRFGYDPRPH